MTIKFSVTENYIATEDLALAVNAAITLGRPLLIKGEPGTGKTQLAEEVAQSLSAPLYRSAFNCPGQSLGMERSQRYDVPKHFVWNT